MFTRPRQPLESHHRGRRGAVDDKGQMFTHLKSAEAWMTVEGRLPVNLKFLIEGEEEVGSRGLEQYLAEHADRLACDSWSSATAASSPPACRPSPTACGIAYYELRVTGPNRDLHSGSSAAR